MQSLPGLLLAWLVGVHRHSNQVGQVQLEEWQHFHSSWLLYMMAMFIKQTTVPDLGSFQVFLKNSLDLLEDKLKLCNLLRTSPSILVGFLRNEDSDVTSPKTNSRRSWLVNRATIWRHIFLLA